MYTGFKDKNHIYAIEVLNDGEWVLGMYDVPTDIASIKKNYLSITTDWGMQTIKLE